MKCLAKSTASRLEERTRPPSSLRISTWAAATPTSKSPSKPISINNWAYFNFALINEETGQAFDFAREVSYYRDSDGDEGSPNNSVIVPGVPSGKYYLRVEPEMDRGAAPVNYELSIKRDVPNNTFFLIAAGLLLIPPIVKTVRRSSFEAQRWRESDYAPMVSKVGTGLAALADD